MPCLKKHKAFLCYLRISTKEGLLLDTDINDQDVIMEEYNKDVYRNCKKCKQTFEIKRAFKDCEDICNGCYILLTSEDIKNVLTPEITVYCSENQLYRICSNLYRSSAQALFRSQNIRDKQGILSKETIYNFLNSTTS